jgi:hypothetical protein
MTEIERMTSPPISGACLWCGRPFPARRGGSPQRFCCSAHRMAFWSALRRWAERAVAAGVLSLDRIRKGDPEACTLLAGAISPARDHEVGKLGTVATPERPGEITVRVALDRMTATQVSELGWGDPFHPPDPEEMAAVVSGPCCAKRCQAILMRR